MTTTDKARKIIETVNQFGPIGRFGISKLANIPMGLSVFDDALQMAIRSGRIQESRQGNGRIVYEVAI